VLHEIDTRIERNLNIDCPLVLPRIIRALWDIIPFRFETRAEGPVKVRIPLFEELDADVAKNSRR
jgi:hypothetical protein